MQKFFEILRLLRHGPLKVLEPFWLLLGKVYRRMYSLTGTTKPVRHFIGGYGPFWLNGHFAFSNFANWGEGHNSAFQRCVETCRGKKCVFDVGAHIGLVSLPMSVAVGAVGSVYAFEPADSNRGFLMDHIVQNGIENIEVCSALVGDSVKENVKFFEQQQATGMNSVIVRKNSGTFRETYKRQCTLDSFCEERGLRPEVIKIDVEGYELSVLRGAQHLIKECAPLIFLSVHPEEIVLLGEQITDLVSLIEQMGYRIEDAEGAVPERLALDEYVLIPLQRG